MSALVTTLVIGGVGVSIFALGGGLYRWATSDGVEGKRPATSIPKAVAEAQKEVGLNWNERIAEKR